MNFAGSSDGLTSIAFPVNWVMRRFRTGIAQGKGAGKIKRVDIGKSPSTYARQLTTKELALLKVVHVRGRK
ncbi:hypothetical protein D3C76_865510 [compost metagenome]